MSGNATRALTPLAICVLLVIGPPGAEAACNCFCKVAKDLGSNPGSSISNFLIQYPNMPSWNNCTFGTAGKKMTCSKACSDATAADTAQYNNDQWLCSKINADYSGNVVAYSAIGTQNYDSASARALTCHVSGPATPQTLALCQQEGQAVALNVSTGLGSIGSKDLNWTVTGGGTAPAAYSTTKVGPWAAPPAPSTHWIQPATGGSPDNNFPPGVQYIYKTTFVVPPAMFLLGVTVQGTFAADDSADVYLNGQYVTGGANFSIAQPFDASSLVQAGLNTLEFRVKNQAHYTGLMVDASVTSKCARCSH
jgi:hypothetical protein